MNHRRISSIALALLLFVLLSSFTSEAPVKRFTPVGSWEYSVPGVQPGYESGTMVVEKNGRDYKVTMVLNEYYQVEAEKVVYKRKELSFSVWVETEEILFSGTFDEDQLTGKISYSEGEFDLTAVRTSE
jgi:hypothetical protein